VDVKSNFVTSQSRLLHVKLQGFQVNITLSSGGGTELQQCQGDASGATDSFHLTALTYVSCGQFCVQPCIYTLENSSHSV